LNAFLIPSQSSGSSSGFVYEYLDSEVVVGTAYYYLLEDLDIFGQTSQHGPVGIVFLGVPTAVKVTGFQAEALPPAQIWPVLLAVAVALGGAAGVRKSRAT
jgi:hypothetical protein